MLGCPHSALRPPGPGSQRRPVHWPWSRGLASAVQPCPQMGPPPSTSTIQTGPSERESIFRGLRTADLEPVATLPSTEGFHSSQRRWSLHPLQNECPPWACTEPCYVQGRVERGGLMQPDAAARAARTCRGSCPEGRPLPSLCAGLRDFPAPNLHFSSLKMEVALTGQCLLSRPRQA